MRERYELFWTNPRSNILRNNSCKATNLPSQKPSKEDKQDMRDTAGEARLNVLLWIPTHRRASVGWPARIYSHQVRGGTTRSDR